MTGQDDSATAGQAGEDEVQKRAEASNRMAIAFGQIVMLMMRSDADRHRSLGDLEWMVVPAITNGQFVVAEAASPETGARLPAAFALWAFVSEEVDRRLSDVSAPVRLQADEWRSGDIPWIIHAGGASRVLPGLLQQVIDKGLKGRQPKMRARGADGKLSAGLLQIREKDAAAGT